ncbi:cytochrome c biogenesis protein CcsA [Marivirga sp. S37H4]|uniref:Cytochrome c biogenesis protein CcsA n=1 Tax=Marivirga aurantiaca TaxID=2802615 RepID=A0A934X032_9BACT|nr:cytochrome c biogenesis protein CcsA [Marivirga aurantiaca]MBK6265921.1 cytochrome c biogenesis protein CcsA [Marivirga aurantiaca]
MRKRWWKILGVALVFYTLIGGLLMEAPRLAILNETIRAMHFHVPMWFGMIIMLTASVVYSIRYLKTGNLKYDTYAIELVNTSILFGLLGLATGMIWAHYTWGAAWSGDPKQNGSAIGLLIYFAYILLRNSIVDSQQKAKISSVYNIFAYATLIPLLFILPRLTDSLHPGNGGNPGFNAYELDGRLRMIFYPAVIGWTLIGVWLTELRIRLSIIKTKIDE